MLFTMFCLALYGGASHVAWLRWDHEFVLILFVCGNHVIMKCLAKFTVFPFFFYFFLILISNSFEEMLLNLVAMACG